MVRVAPRLVIVPVTDFKTDETLRKAFGGEQVIVVGHRPDSGREATKGTNVVAGRVVARTRLPPALLALAEDASHFGFADKAAKPQCLDEVEDWTGAPSLGGVA